MISHKHKCIFIHIAKCAGTSIEHAFGVDVVNHNAEENEHLFGWDNRNKLWLQHATPQQLIDLGYINEDTWNTYYKFIVFRNSWDRAYSDYLWMQNVRNICDTFENFINKSGNFKKILNDQSSRLYAGDHLYLQKSYFFLNNHEIKYETVINFDTLQVGVDKVLKDLNLDCDFFSTHLNSSKSRKNIHYSKFYNYRKKKLIAERYKEDIDFFHFKFEDKRSFLQKVSGFIL